MAKSEFGDTCLEHTLAARYQRQEFWPAMTIYA